MRLFHSIAQWRKAQYEKKLAKMREEGKCPVCHGHGFNYYIFSEFIHIDPQHGYCPGCNGSGLFSDWADLSQNPMD
mgnify:FL=1